MKSQKIPYSISLDFWQSSVCFYLFLYSEDRNLLQLENLPQQRTHTMTYSDSKIIHCPALLTLLGRSGFLVAIVGILFATTGCTELLKADFETFTTNQPLPSGGLPGSPIGDEIFVFDEGSGDITVINSGSSKQLRLLALSNSSDIFTKFIPMDPWWFQPENIYITFTGTLISLTENNSLNIYYDVGSGSEACRLTIENDLFLRLSSGESSNEFIGFILPGQPHDVVIRLDIPNQQCSIVVIQPEAPLIRQDNKPFITGVSEFSGIFFHIFSGTFFETSNVPEVVYLIDQIIISTVEP